MRFKKEYLEVSRRQYEGLGRKDKGLMINEACRLFGWDRKHAIKALNRRVSCGGLGVPRIRRKKYGLDISELVISIWKEGGRPCAVRLKAMIPEWLGYFEQHYGELDEIQRAKLLECSIRTLGIMIRDVKLNEKEPPARYFKLKSRRIKEGAELSAGSWDLKAAEWMRERKPRRKISGLKGGILSSLTWTDEFSGWREFAGVYSPSDEVCWDSIAKMHAALPFHLPAVATKNEFVHETLRTWLAGGKEHVEPDAEPSETTSTKLSDTDLRSTPSFAELAELVTDLYVHSWLPLRNHFLPVMKMVGKAQVGESVKKQYDQALSPYQRLMSSGLLNHDFERQLRECHHQLDPFKLAREVGEKIRYIQNLVEMLPGNPTNRKSKRIEMAC